MNAYLLCFLGPDGRVRYMQDMICHDDQMAIERTARFDHQDGVELWGGNHLLKRFDPKLN
jgi:hypothetical protein